MRHATVRLSVAAVCHLLALAAASLLPSKIMRSVLINKHFADGIENEAQRL